MHVHGGDIYTYQNMLDYSANINPLGIPQRIIDAVTEGAKRSAEYPDVQCRELRKALSQSENIPQEQIICGNGAADHAHRLAGCPNAAGGGKYAQRVVSRGRSDLISHGKTL